MPIVLCRVDDRLVHGQVVIGWGRPLGVEFIALVDEGVSASSWEQDLYRMAVPPEIDVRFVTVAEAAAQLGAWQAGERRGIILTGDLETMAVLHRADPAVVHRINLGGIHHHRPGAARSGGSRGDGGGDHGAGPPDDVAGRAPGARMTELAPHAALLLVVWGTLVALDLVSVPQAMISRPLVVGAVAGWLAGDVEAGLRVGVLLELFALDVLPIGAVRYPDYGPATVVGTALAVGAPWELGLGLSVGVALVLAVVGGWSLLAVRRLNVRAIQRRTAALAAGESRAIRLLQYGGLFRDAARGALLTIAGLLVAWAVARWVTLDRQTAVGLTLIAIGSGLSAAAAGAVRSAGRGARLKWLAAGVGAGALLAVLR